MPSFKACGKEWLVAVDGPAIRACRAELGIDIGARDCSQLQILSEDWSKANDVLWVLCRKQAASYGIDQEAFDSALGGDAGEAAADALFEGIIDFFPSRQRVLLRDALAKNREVLAAAEQVAAERLTSRETVEAMKAAAVAEVNAAIDKALENLTRRPSATDSPA